MLRNYFIIAWRNMRRHASYTFINLIGLSVGIGCFLLIALYIRYEYSFDNYHENGHRIFRVTSYSGFTKKQWNGSTSGDPVPAMLESYPEVENATRLRHCGTDKLYLDGTWLRDIKMRCAESALFDIFSFNLIQGDAATVLDRPNTAVITKSLSKRLFGDENPIGKTLPVTAWRELGEVSTEITGLMDDIPANTHFTADLFISFESLRNSTLCLDCGATAIYTRLTENANLGSVSARLLTLIRDTLGKERVEDIGLESISQIHFSDLYAEKQGDLRYVYLLSAIAIIILLIACANYMNLATARGIGRSREIGIRKVVGARRTQIVRQFLTETLLLALLAIPIALFLLIVFTSYFNTLAETNVLFLWSDAQAYAGLILLIMLMVGLAAGVYPALFLSRRQPIEVLHSNTGSKNSGGGLRKMLVGGQFAASIFLILGTIIIFGQLKFMQQKKLGFDYDQVIIVDINDPALKKTPETVKQIFLQQAGVIHASAGFRFPGQASFGGMMNIDYPFGREEDPVILVAPTIDKDFLETMNIPVIAGRNLSPAGPDREILEVLVNPATIHAMRWGSQEEALGQKIFGGRFEVVGMVPDFHYASLHKEIEPLMLKQNDDNTASKLALRLEGGQVQSVLLNLEKTWNQTGTTLPFEYKFLDDEINQLYEQEQRTAKVFGIFASLAIVIACLGLIGLAMFTATQRTKEIGIRKVLGASITHLIQLLTSDFLKIVLVAFIIAAPLAYFAAVRWLEAFAYRMELTAGPFILTGGVALLITLITISTQAFRTASANPVNSLRQE